MESGSHSNLEIARVIDETYDDPLGFVQLAYPWGEPGELAGFTGPDGWQRAFMEDLGSAVRARGFDGIHAVAPIRMATASGHGIGKSTLVAWIVDWIMSTRPHCQGTITANTYTQLETKTWAAIQKWTRLCVTGYWLQSTGNRMYHRHYPQTWFCSAQSCREENSEAFAGQHAVSSTSFYLFDEASAIPDKIFEVAEGGLTDGEPMIFAFGNPTRASGKFHRVTFGSERERWNNRSIDSRTCMLPNKTQIAEWVEDYGEDSDFVRVRVRGLPPRAGDMQFIDSERVWDAQRRPAICLKDDPIIAGVDVARGGGDWNVVRFRKGLDGRSIPPIRIPGEHTRDSTLLVSKLAELLADHRPERKIHYMFIDSALGGPIVNRLHQLGFRNVGEVNFGSQSTDVHQANMRAYMWTKMKDWLLGGAIPADSNLEQDLIGPGFHHNNRDQLVIESKESMQKRGLHSTDDGDALALTFARAVGVPRPKIESAPVYIGKWS